MKISTDLPSVLLVVTLVLLTSSEVFARKLPSLSQCDIKIRRFKGRQMCLQFGSCNNMNCPKKCDECRQICLGIGI